MAVPPLFKDIGKTVKDTLEKDYEKNTPSIKLESKTENETFTFEGRRDPATNTFAVDPFSFKYDFKERGITFLGKVNSSRKISTEFALTDKLTQGLKLTAALNTTLAKPDQNVDTGAKVGVEYKRDNLTATTELELVKRTANLSAVVGNKNISGGFEVALDLNDGVPSAYNLATQYVNGSNTICGFIRDQLKTLKGGFYRKVSDQVSVAADFDIKLRNNVETNFTLGTHYSLDKESAVKAKLNTKGVVSVSYIHFFKKNIRGVFTMEADAFNLNKPDSAKIGFGLSFTDE